jgi:hypothetical protein
MHAEASARNLEGIGRRAADIQAHGRRAPVGRKARVCAICIVAQQILHSMAF